MGIVNVFLIIFNDNLAYVKDVFYKQMVLNVLKIHFELIKYIITIFNILIIISQ
jgi:hypothetical protein